LEHWDELIWGILLVVPKSLTVGLLLALLGDFISSQLSEIEDHVLASEDHLIGDLDEEVGHSLVGVVVPGDGVDHLDGVHESWKCLLDGVRVSVVEWINELLKSLEVLNVILGLVECFSDSELNASPLGGSKVDLISWLTTLVSWAL
jgi:hypothetical protein